MAQALTLGISGFSYADLYHPERLADLYQHFGQFVNDSDTPLYTEFQQYRQCQGKGMSSEAISDILVRLAPLVGQFVARLFNVEADRDAQIKAIQDEMQTIFTLKNQIIKAANKKFRREKTDQWDIDAIKQQVSLFVEHLFPKETLKADPEYKIAWAATTLDRLVNHFENEVSDEADDCAEILQQWREILSSNANTQAVFAEFLQQQQPLAFVEALLDCFQRWVFIAPNDPELKATINKWLAFKAPGRTDFQHLVPTESHSDHGYEVLTGPQDSLRRRDGFALTDKRYDSAPRFI